VVVIVCGVLFVWVIYDFRRLFVLLRYG